MTLSRLNVSDRHRIMPGMQSVTLYRVNARDEVTAVQEVIDGAEVRPVSRSDQAGEQPTKSKKCVINLWVDLMAGWELEEFDLIRHGSNWWIVDDATLGMLESRYVANCSESKDPT